MRWHGAVQAQDYPAAKWALGLRAVNLTDTAVERAFADGTILRTHVMRPTWHFVTPADIRWLLALTSPRVSAAMSHYNRRLELDDRVFARSRRVLERALEGSNYLTRAELADALGRAGIKATSQRLGHLMMQAELDQVICSGPRRGKQFTYALFDDRVPRAPALTRAEALAKLTQRYFSSHGPATVRDYAWWSGLTLREANTGMHSIASALRREIVGKRTYWSTISRSSTALPSRTAFLLPNYDEYLIAYKDRDLVVAPSRGGATDDSFAHRLVVNGRLTGSWTRTIHNDAIVINITSWVRLTRLDAREVEAAAARFGAFMRCSVKVWLTGP